MSWTKRQFVNQAFEEIGLATYVFDLEPEQLQGALRRLDAMMATWNARGIRIGYPLPTSPENSDLDTETNVPDAANEAIYTNLAIRIAPTVGKTVSVDTKIAARTAYNTILRKITTPIEQSIANLPYGAGHKPWREREFMPDATEPLDAGTDGRVTLE